MSGILSDEIFDDLEPSSDDLEAISDDLEAITNGDCDLVTVHHQPQVPRGTGTTELKLAQNYQA